MNFNEIINNPLALSTYTSFYLAIALESIIA